MSLLLTDEDLRIIKKLELEIAVEIKRICELHNIKYSIFAGTLLGAVRHGGFIPWDDDIDMAMMNDEYEKFCKIAPEELNSKFEMVNYETNAYFGEPFTKIMYKGTIMREQFIGKSDVPCGVFVDIFHLDSVPDSKLLQSIHRLKNYTLRKMILLKSEYDFRKTGIKKVLYKVLKDFSGDKEHLVKLYRKNQNLYNKNRNTQYVTPLGSNYGYKREMVPRKWFATYTTLKFEGIPFMVISEYKKWLEHYYSDYMQLPPVEQQINKHTVVELDLTNFGGRKAEN